MVASKHDKIQYTNTDTGAVVYERRLDVMLENLAGQCRNTQGILGDLASVACSEKVYF
jgi:hypothetical protein